MGWLIRMRKFFLVLSIIVLVALLSAGIHNKVETIGSMNEKSAVTETVSQI
jgi:predicted small secreted protein